jgi:hypothetical protein
MDELPKALIVVDSMVEKMLLEKQEKQESQ